MKARNQTKRRRENKRKTQKRQTPEQETDSGSGFFGGDDEGFYDKDSDWILRGRMP